MQEEDADGSGGLRYDDSEQEEDDDGPSALRYDSDSDQSIEFSNAYLNRLKESRLDNEAGEAAEEEEEDSEGGEQEGNEEGNEPDEQDDPDEGATGAASTGGADEPEQSAHGPATGEDSGNPRRISKPLNRRLQLKKLQNKMPLFGPGGTGFEPLPHAQQASLRLSLRNQLKAQETSDRLVKNLHFNRIQGSRLKRLNTNERAEHNAAVDAQQALIPDVGGGSESDLIPAVGRGRGRGHVSRQQNSLQQALQQPDLIPAVGRGRGRVSRQQNARQQALEELPRDGRFLRYGGRLERLNTGERAVVNAAADAREALALSAQSPVVVSRENAASPRTSPMAISPLAVDFSQRPA